MRLWTPKVGYGEWKFGYALPSQIEHLKLEPTCEGADWDVYQISGEFIRVSVSDGLITSIECWDEFFFESHNLVGLPMVKCSDLLGSEFVLDAVSPYSGEEEFRNEGLGLTLWVEGGVVSGLTIDQG